MNSIYTKCANAIRDLASTGQPFTDLDAVQRAAEPSWTEEDYRKAMTRANQIAQAFYKDGKLVRFGPVRLPDGSQDYVRFAARIVHVTPSGPGVIKTPNGDFPQLRSINDAIGGAGRRKGTNRDDSKLWPAQSDGEVENLRRQLNDALRRITDLEERDRRVARVLAP